MSRIKNSARKVRNLNVHKNTSRLGLTGAPRQKSSNSAVICTSKSCSCGSHCKFGGIGDCSNKRDQTNSDSTDSLDDVSFHLKSSPMPELDSNASQASDEIPDSIALNPLLREEDLARVQLFHTSSRHLVYVCRCTVTLYKHDILARRATPQAQWNHIDEGALMIQFEKDPELNNYFIAASIRLAKPLSGFDVWKETLSCESHYESHNQCFHSLVSSKDRLVKYGFLFGQCSAALEFHAEVRKFLTNHGELLTFDQKKRKKLLKAQRVEKKRLNIHDISIPLDYQHVTCLNSNLIYDEMMAVDALKDGSILYG